MYRSPARRSPHGDGQMMMQRGSQTLSSIGQGVDLIQDQVRETDEIIKEDSKNLVELQKQQAERYKRMARVRLDEVISGKLAAGLDAAGLRVGELLQIRSEAQKSLGREIDGAHTERTDLEAQRSALNDRASQAARALDTAEAATQHRLAQDEAYQAQLKKTREAEHIADHAEEKSKRAQESRQKKGKPYQDDPLFSYLWGRSYGTSSYSANSLMRYLDKWVARLCHYHGARPNYAMLLEIPKRLGEHAQRVRATADEEFANLMQFEEKAAEADGVPALRGALERAQSELDQIDTGIEGVEDRLRDLETQRTRFASGNDEHIENAIETLSSAFEHEKLNTLYEYARATATAEDDVLVRELESGAQRAMEIKETLAENKRVRERHLDRLKALENVRRRFKKQRYDSAHSGFGNAAAVTMILNQFLRGVATSGELWGTIEREQRYRRMESNPDFGSGGFGGRQGTWHYPFPRSGGGGSRGGGLGRGGLGGGGFRTGGGF